MAEKRTRKYRVFYELIHVANRLRFGKDINAKDNQEAIKKARKIVERKNKELKKMGYDGPLDYCALISVSRLRVSFVFVRVKKEKLESIFEPIPLPA